MGKIQKWWSASRLKVILAAIAGVIGMIFLAFMKGRRQGKAFGKAEGRAEEQHDELKEQLETGDTEGMREDALKWARRK